MARSASGRMINQDIALSAKVASLSSDSLALFCLLIPHFNAHGKMLANPHAIKGNVCPLVDWLTVEKIETCLAEISKKTNVKWWKDDKGLHYLQSLNWHQHQELRSDRLGNDRIPDYPGDCLAETPTEDFTPGSLPDFSRTTPGVIQDHSRTTPELLPPEVEVEVEEEGRKKPSSDALRLSGLLVELIAGNNPESRSIQPKGRGKSIERWAADIDRMLRLDGRDLQKVEEVIRWCQADDFWRGNILSGAKLREKFDQLTMQMQRDGQVGRRSGEVVPIGRRVY